MSVILPYLFILSTSFSLMYIFNKEFSKVLVLSFIIPVFFLYLGGLIENIKLGLYISILFSLIWIVYSIKNKKFEYKKLLDPNILIFTIIFILISIYFRQAYYNQYDEFTHWGPMVKEMYRLNKFYCVSDSLLRVHKDYPPFTSLLELLWCYLSRGYMERNTLRAMCIFSMSFIFPVSSYIKDNKRNILSCVFGVIVYLLLFIINYENGLETALVTIYPDALCSLLSAYIIFEIIVSDSYDTYKHILISLLLTSLILIKQVNLAFYMMAITLIIIKYIINKKDKKDYLNLLIYFVVIPLLLYKSWNFYINIHDYYVFRQFELDLPSVIDALKTIIGKESVEYRITTKDNFYVALLTKPMLNFNITYIPICVLIAIALFIIIYKNINKKEAILSTSIYIIGAIGYVFMMLILYLTSFSEYEAVNLASFERYFETYVLFSLALLVFLIVSYYQVNKSNLLICLSTFIILLAFAYNDYTKFKVRKIEDSYRNEEAYLNMFNQFDAYLSIDDDVLVIDQYEDATAKLYVRYEYLGYPVHFEVIKDISYEQFKEEYKEYDYIYTLMTNEDFYQNYWLDKEQLPLLNNRLYKVNDDGTLSLMDWEVIEFN